VRREPGGNEQSPDQKNMAVIDTKFSGVWMEGALLGEVTQSQQSENVYL
jgi:hypothetical protein